MRNMKLTLEYDGTRYQGWQRLGKGESKNTVSNKILEVIHRMTGETVELNCGARTEVGVHAYGQVVNFKTTSDLSPLEMMRYLNRYLPMDIAVTEAQDMPERFHASLNARSRTYRYRIAIAPVPSVFERKYTYHSFKIPDLTIMKQAVPELIGIHDFQSFSTVKRNKSTAKELYNIDICQNPEEIQITLEANDFLHNMPRMIIGTLMDIGLGKRQKDCLGDIFGGRGSASAPCDPQGLFLQSIRY